MKNIVMIYFYNFNLLIILTLFSVSEPLLKIPSQVNRPPTFSKLSDEIYYVLPEGPITLTCKADAHPSITNPGGYTWKKNGQPLDVLPEDKSAPIGSIIMSERDSGTIDFKGVKTLTDDKKKKYEGIYQCFATDGNAIAMSRNITVVIADVVSQFPQDLNVTVQDGNSASLPCNHPVREDVEISWKFRLRGDSGPTSEVQYSDRIILRPDWGLELSNVQADSDNITIFWCVVTNKKSRRSTQGPHHKLIVLTDDPIRSKQTEIVVPENDTEQVTVLRGEKLRLTCVTIGKPTPTVLWEKLSGDWPSGRTAKKNFQKTLEISDVTFADKGSYRCKANNSIDSFVFKTVNVTVHAKPYFASDDEKLRDIIKEPGENATLRCKPEGIPTPVVEWRMNGKVIQNFNTKKRQVHARRIELKNLEKNESAVYQCISTNKYGSKLEQAYVNVITCPPVPLQDNKELYRAAANSSVELKCHFFGAPSPTIVWSRGSTNDVTINDRFSLQKQKHLKIDNVQRKGDGGTYTCHARNPYGKNSIAMALDVLQPTTIKSIGKSEVEMGKTIVLTVEVSKDPKLPGNEKVRWTKNSSELKLEHNNTLTIENANFKDAGIYEASITTEVDNAKTTINLVVMDKPLPPRNFRFVESADDDLKLTFLWTPGFDNFSPITEYKIDFEENRYNPNSWTRLRNSISGSTNSTEVSLSPGVNYRFRIKSKNSVGWSIWSNVTARYRTPNGLPSNPTGVQGKPTSPGKMLITWRGVDGLDQNAPGFGYLVSYRLADTEDNWKKKNVSGNKNIVEISGDEPNIEYLVNLQSYNEEGLAKTKTKSIRVYTGEDVPIASPMGVNLKTVDAKPTEVVVSWVPVDVSKVRGKILGYIIKYQEVGENDIFNETVGNINTVTIQNLRPATEYMLNVSVYNKVGIGPPSEPKARRTPSGVPSRGSVNVTTKANRAKVTWFPSNGVPPKQLLVQYSKNKDKEVWINDTRQYDARLEPMSMDIQSLEPSTLYYFRVLTTNDHGYSISEVHTVTTSHAELLAGGVTSELWFIILMCVIGLLVLVILIICFVRRGKGGKYSVAEKEHQLVESHQINMDDSAEYKDEIDDVKKPLTTPTEASGNGKSKPPPGQVTLGAALRTRGDSVGGDSIEAFVGADSKEFNEDGSFIGQYGAIHGESGNTTPGSPPSSGEKSPTLLRDSSHNKLANPPEQR